MRFGLLVSLSIIMCLVKELMMSRFIRRIQEIRGLTVRSIDWLIMSNVPGLNMMSLSATV